MPRATASASCAPAERLFAERGAGCVSMDEIAEAAGVGKGTLFRRFGSRAALALARAHRARARLSGRAHPRRATARARAPPRERLIAFGEARARTLAAHAELLPRPRSDPRASAHPPYARVPAAHDAAAAGGGPELRRREPRRDAARRASGVDFFLYLRDAREIALERLKAGWARAGARVVARAAGAR